MGQYNILFAVLQLCYHFKQGIKSYNSNTQYLQPLVHATQCTTMAIVVRCTQGMCSRELLLHQLLVLRLFCVLSAPPSLLNVSFENIYLPSQTAYIVQHFCEPQICVEYVLSMKQCLVYAMMRTYICQFSYKLMLVQDIDKCYPKAYTLGLLLLLLIVSHSVQFIANGYQGAPFRYELSIG